MPILTNTLIIVAVLMTLAILCWIWAIWNRGKH